MADKIIELKNVTYTYPLVKKHSLENVSFSIEKGKLYAEEASAFRMIVDLRNRISLTCHPYGASSNMESPNYTSQMRMFIEGGYKRLKTIDYYQNNYNFYEL